MTKNKKTDKKNDNIINIIIIVAIIFLVGALIFMFTKSDGTDNRISEISYSDYQEIIKEDKYSIILLTNPTCVHCNNYKPFVNYVALEYDLDVYNIDLSKVTYDEYKALHDAYSAIKEKYDNDTPLIPTPATIVVKNGGEVASILGDIGYDGLVKLLKSNKVIK